MAWMRMMGADSVDYHRATVIDRSDDHPGQALAYYASRGETPLVWGGSGAAGLGLVGSVTDAQYEAIYGPGGAKDPTTGEQLTRTRRPGMELVVAAHKSVAELGVIGRAEDMHRILDAERDATLAYLDSLVRQRGGRRGEASVVCPTQGLIYAVTRHATSRAGDPSPHDHVLVANMLRMEDERGGWKAADTSLWREHLHAATMFGRVASARVAIQLGYGIVPDDGPSGRLGQWAIAGVPQEVLDVHSKRAAEIVAETERRGFDSYRARGVVARDHRPRKRHDPIGELMPVWRAELESVGWPVPALRRSVNEAFDRGRREPLIEAERAALVADALASDGPLAARKVFSRRDVVVAVAPRLFGLDPAELPRVVNAALASPEAVALVATPMARERAYATAATIAVEAAIAAAVEVEMHRRDAPATTETSARRAIEAQEHALGVPLTAGQRETVMGVATSRRGVDLVVGVAGSGKTTALAAVREAFEAEDFEVIRASTSGQAARTLKRQAGVEESRTLASLIWRLDHRPLALTDGHVVVLDEAAMTEDAALLRLLEAASTARAKVVLVGDHRQLGAVGPGGGFESLVARYGPAVHVLADNVRQRDVAERAALAELRDGDVAKAVAWYGANGRVVVAADRAAAVEAVVSGWAADVVEGRHTAMYAWRRANVAELNRWGRTVWRSLGRLGDEELVAPGGAAYAVGDRVVTLAPAAGGKVVTSEMGTVLNLDMVFEALHVRMDDDGEVRRLEADEIGADRLAHSYAVTVHRSQGSTVERAHALEDGGGRELAYVKMSRAKERSSVYVVADSVEQAAEDLRRDWTTERRLAWVIDRPVAGLAAAASPATEPVAERRARLAAERAALVRAIPQDPSAEIKLVLRDKRRLQRQRERLATGAGAYAREAIGDALAELGYVEQEIRRADAAMRDGRLARKERRYWRDEVERLGPRRTALTVKVAALAGSEVARLEETDQQLDERLAELNEQRNVRRSWLQRHPEAEGRLQELDVAIARLDDGRDGVTRVPERTPPVPHRYPAMDLGL